MTVNFKLRRRSLFFTFNFILPSLIITICCIVGFILPAECDEKIGLRIENIFSYRKSSLLQSIQITYWTSLNFMFLRQ
jgi:hypothetical protein